MHSARLRRATLTGAVLSKVAARDADLENADLQQANLRESDLRGAILLEADLSEADLTGANLAGADLRSANLTGAILDGACLDGADLAGARLDGISLHGMTAKAARIRAVESQSLADALRAAGAQSRLPLTWGRWTHVLVLFVATIARVFGATLGLAWSATLPVREKVQPIIQPIAPMLGQLVSGLHKGFVAITKTPTASLRHLRSGSHWATKAMGRQAHRSRDLASKMRGEVQDRIRQAALNREERARLKTERIEQARNERAARAQARLPGGPGADLRGQDFRGQKLNFAVWHEAQLQDATLDGAHLDKADLRKAILENANLLGTRLRDADLRGANLTQAQFEGARLQGSLLSGINAHRSNWTDADLRHADLRGADLTGANLTGADLRNARLSGAILTRANLTGVRMPDVDLVDTVLDHASLEQADVAGVRWVGTSVNNTDLTGVIGMSARQRDILRQHGALVDDIHLERLLGRLGTRPVQVGMGILAVGMATYLAARFAGTDVINPAQLEVQAQNLREENPKAASDRYVELAGLARRVEDQVGYLVEASMLADMAGQTDDAESQLRSALDAAQDIPLLASETRLQLAQFLHKHQNWTDSFSAVEPLVTEIDQPTEQRARAIVLYDKTRDALGLTDEGPRESIFSAMGDLPETQADLHLALAELYTNEGETTRALVEVNTAATLEIPEDIQIRLLESRARIHDRSGNYDAAIKTWGEVKQRADPSAIAAQAAQLAVADLNLRQGRINKAHDGLRRLLDERTDDRIRGRALLVAARIAEKRDRPEDAVDAYRKVLAISDLDTETSDEARIAMASLVLADPENADASGLLAELDPDAMSEVMAHARLGEARSLLDAGNAANAHKTYLTLMDMESLPTAVRRASRAGLGEALAQMGELRDALDIWRELLAEPASSHDRTQLELLIANGLLQGGKRKEASTAFRSLADSENTEARLQGLLGLAEVARAGSERARARSLYRQVADQEVDTTWNVRALQELADMAAEDGNGDVVVSITRELLGALPPSHPIAPEARLSLVSALLQISDIQEADRVCRSALDAAPNQAAQLASQVACAEVWERSGDWKQAIESYKKVLQQPADPDVLTDATLGIARSAFAVDQPAEALEATQKTLELAEAPALRLPLLSMQIRALRLMDKPVEYRTAIAERDALAEQVPDVAWLAFVDDAGQSRTSGQPEIAVDLLQRTLDLPITNEQRAAVLVQLGAALLDLSRVEEAEKRLSQANTLAVKDSPEAFYAGMGLADVARRNGQPTEALAMLENLTPPDKAEQDAWMVAKANALTEAGDPAAQAAWVSLAEAQDTDPETQYTALKGQADALLAKDNSEEAIPIFEKARTVAIEDWQKGWAAIGLATALAEAKRVEGATTLLDELRNHSDPEVRMEAALRRSQYASDAEEWNTALRVLQPREAIDLGPGWDASSTQARTRALSGAGDLDGAEAAWRALARRWPDEEEALLPSWIGLAQMALDAGDSAEAHRWARKAFKEARDPGYREQAQTLVRSLAE